MHLLYRPMPRLIPADTFCVDTEEECGSNLGWATYVEILSLCTRNPNSYIYFIRPTLTGVTKQNSGNVTS